jgi:hypothetical protein
MIRIVCGTVVCLAMLVGSASADFEYWRVRSLTGTIRALAVDPTNGATVWAARSNAATVQGTLGTPYGNGVALSTDGGATFEPRNTGLTNLFVTSLAIDPSATSTVYAGTDGGGVFRTTDAGLSWAPRNVGLGDLHVYGVAVDPQNPMTLYAGLANGGLFRSVDAGLSWTATSGLGGLTVWQVAFDPVTPTTLFAATSGGVKKSVNNGLNWTSTGTLVVQEDGGDPYQVSDTRSVVVDVATPGRVYAGLWDGAGVFTSTDGGTTWTHTSTGLRSRFGNWRFVNQVVQDIATPATLYAVTMESTYRSIDGGVTWVVFEAGLARGAAYTIATTSTGGAFVASVWGEVHDLATRTSGVDHMRCLSARARGFAPRSVSVTDRFGTASVTILKPFRFCTPTSLSGDPVANPTTHLACYKVRGPKIAPIDIPFLTNRLDGFRAYTVNKNDTLCVSATIVGDPPSPPRDAYRCMRGPRYTSPMQDLVLTDGFGTQPVRQSRNDRMCSPTDVDGAGRIEPDIELRCDKLLGPRPASVPSTITIADQFGTTQLAIGRADSHCVQALNTRD